MSDHGIERHPAGEYARLLAIVKRQGCFDRQYAYYARKIAFTLVAYAAGLAGLAWCESVLFLIADAALLAFVFGQLGLLGHDAAHHQICRSPRLNRALALLHLNLLTGISLGWWLDKHNRHHAHPNHAARDPDIDFPILAFSDDQALAARGFARFMVKYQACFFFPLLLLEGFNLRVQTLATLASGAARQRWTEGTLALAHFALFVGCLVCVLGPGRGLCFLVIHHALTGLYLGSAFAPGHIGMCVFDADPRLDFVRRQVLTTRNVRPHPLVDFWYGGLNYQIEHHLFPGMPRNQLGHARRLVREFCAAERIPYRETGIVVAYREVMEDLRRVSAPLRAR
jgi:fatty acid desaturase